MNNERGNPGTFISDDKRYLYTFQGFINRVDIIAGSEQKVSQALKTIERLDLWNESNGWELLNI